ncbi:hypothetical protein CLMAG_11280 [Clostridium magnum DSM 2767]|uniref:Uncharacterized protein n=1 Tax=Clostridium magnum DSM 2767 TaxID=1121326 RepID=A0A162UMA8_9CLOT|nr:hypothetical protein CLMAG_11280 [Clostridium magnum DSM 2767]
MGLADNNLYFTYEQFLELAESIRANTGYRTEYTNGEII